MKAKPEARYACDHLSVRSARGVIFPDIDPIVHIGPWALQWGPLALRWYALAYVAGILLGWRYAIRLVRDAKLWGGQNPRPPRRCRSTTWCCGSPWASSWAGASATSCSTC
jgi:hypothetical protein